MLTTLLLLYLPAGGEELEHNQKEEHAKCATS